MENRNTIKNKTILITGGTGSFGNEVVSSLLTFKPKSIVVFSRDEKKQFDMRNKYASPILKFIIGDVREKSALEKLMGSIPIDHVFHAAALKQVPTGEFFPMEVVKTNTLGTNNVIEASIASGVKKVVILSTDKAVYPINAMGMSKALMEKIMIAASREIDHRGKTILSGVRYGNVMYTRGSVIPYFVSLIKQNKKLPVTSLRMTRFMLPLKESVDLVLYALTSGENGHLYVRKSPAATLETLAKALCQIFNHQKGYKEIGIRAGEKMHETLVTAEEMMRASDLGKYYQIPPESQGLEYRKYFFVGKKADAEKIEPFTSENAKRLNLKQTVNLLLSQPEIKEQLKNIQK